MPKTKPTQQRMTEILATKGMGWKAGAAKSLTGDRMEVWMTCPQDWIAKVDWNPLTDLNAIRELEDRLTGEQRLAYQSRLSAMGSTDASEYEWFLRHADARTCAEALARTLAPEEFETCD